MSGDRKSITLESFPRSNVEQAKIAEIDYKINGHRCRANIGEFVGPRWVPDPEVTQCKSCGVTFDVMNRRHHCRNCGYIFCDSCSSKHALLQSELGIREPQRVCFNCYGQLSSIQNKLIQQIANHTRENNIDIVSNSSPRFCNMPYATTLSSEIRKAAYTLHNILNGFGSVDKSLPLSMLQAARGVAFLTVAKGGFIFAPRIGSGLVITRRLDGSWSAPSAIGTLGVSWGFLAGIEVTDYLITLNNDSAVQAFTSNTQLSVGAQLDIAVGPIGRSGAADLHASRTNGAIAAAYSYSCSRGLYAGVSLEGTVIYTRSDVNCNFYGREVSPGALLCSTHIPQPRAAQCLYDALDAAIGRRRSVVIPPPLPSHAPEGLGPRRSKRGSENKAITVPQPPNIEA